MFHRLRISLLVAGCSALAKDPGRPRCVMIIYLVPAAILTIRLLAAGGLPEDELA